MDISQFGNSFLLHFFLFIFLLCVYCLCVGGYAIACMYYYYTKVLAKVLSEGFYDTGETP